ncbi:MAG: hypothetical protein ABL903_00220 [Methylococcales bacterium]
MIAHVLAGDALANRFPTSISGTRIICRECLISGDLHGENLQDFWQTRANFIQPDYAATTYFEDVVSEFQKLIQLDVETELYLWFEYELFCQTNFWFVLHLLQMQGFKHVFRVCPIIRGESELWKGFAPLDTTGLEHCFAENIKMSASDLLLGEQLWRAYQTTDLLSLAQLSHKQSAAFPLLKEVCEAEIARKRDNRVEQLLKDIISTGAQEFSEVFTQFQEQAGVYGFGDLQVKTLYERLLHT